MFNLKEIFGSKCWLNLFISVWLWCPLALKGAVSAFLLL